MDDEDLPCEDVLAMLGFTESTEPTVVIRETQRIRKRLLREQFVDSKVPKEADEVKLALEILRDLDYTALQETKIKVDSESSVDHELIKAVLNNIGGASVFRKDEAKESDKDNNKDRDVTIDRSRVKEYERVEGEDVQGDDPINPKDFLA